MLRGQRRALFWQSKFLNADMDRWFTNSRVFPDDFLTGFSKSRKPRCDGNSRHVNRALIRFRSQLLVIQFNEADKPR